MSEIQEKRQSGRVKEYHDKSDEQNPPAKVESAERPKEESKDCREKQVLWLSSFGFLWHGVLAAA
jgi:hypothetical protein